MRTAILDLGTNTFHLLIAEVKNGRYKILFKSKIAVKLGEGSIQHNWIAPKPFRRGVNTLIQFKKVIEKYKPAKVSLYATSAIRSAGNGANFIRAVKKETGFSIRVISGKEEAELICLGVRQCFRLDEPSLIMDIGGGSIEFIIADAEKIYWKGSFNVGAARLLGLFYPTDPIRKNEIRRIEEYLVTKLVKLENALKKYPVRKLIGSSGSFDTFAEMTEYHFQKKKVVRILDSYKFDLAEFNKLGKLIIGSTLQQRLVMKGLLKMRADMIVVAAVCTKLIIRKAKIKEMFLSKYALKEGALWKEVKQLL